MAILLAFPISFYLIEIFVHLFIYAFVCESVCVCGFHSACLEVTGQTLGASSLSRVTSGSWCQVVRLSNKCLYALNHSTGPKVKFLESFLLVLNYKCMRMSVRGYAHMSASVLGIQKRGSDPRPGVKVILGVGKHTWLLCRRSTHLQLLSHLSRASEIHFKLVGQTSCLTMTFL